MPEEPNKNQRNINYEEIYNREEPSTYEKLTAPMVPIYHGPMYEAMESFRQAHPILGGIGRLGTAIAEGYTNPLSAGLMSAETIASGGLEIPGMMAKEIAGQVVTPSNIARLAKWTGLAGRATALADMAQGAGQMWHGKNLKEKLAGAMQTGLAALDAKAKYLHVEEMIPHHLKLSPENIERIVDMQREAIYSLIERLGEPEESATEAATGHIRY